LFIVSFILGGERINMYGYFIFLYYALPVNKGYNIDILVTAVFFLVKNYLFVASILSKGTGFI
jgi:hypothetical protein